MLRIALTGGIASGKTTVAAMLRDREYPVLDADALGHELLEPGQATYEAIVGEFGSGILGRGGAIDRSKLGAIVFADPACRAALNAIVHPRIRDISEDWFRRLDRPDGPAMAFEDAALIYEAKLGKNFDRVVVCWCKPEQQVARLRERGLSVEQARQRIASQMPIDEKRRLADDVIDCSGSIESTESQVVALVARLQQLAAASAPPRPPA
ncbi:MAG TPA: dephospho-CoA kinase [Candidatus Aquilonibacter sp.]|nr:dephospho-CoA kinase [Candidatus Aquilonibacter sp.]